MPVYSDIAKAYEIVIYTYACCLILFWGGYSINTHKFTRAVRTIFKHITHSNTFEKKLAMVVDYHMLMCPNRLCCVGVLERIHFYGKLHAQVYGNNVLQTYILRQNYVFDLDWGCQIHVIATHLISRNSLLLVLFWCLFCEDFPIMYMCAYVSVCLTVGLYM